MAVMVDQLRPRLLAGIDRAPLRELPHLFWTAPRSPHGRCVEADAK